MTDVEKLRKLVLAEFRDKATVFAASPHLDRECANTLLRAIVEELEITREMLGAVHSAAHPAVHSDAYDALRTLLDASDAE